MLKLTNKTKKMFEFVIIPMHRETFLKVKSFAKTSKVSTTVILDQIIQGELDKSNFQPNTTKKSVQIYSDDDEIKKTVRGLVQLTENNKLLGTHINSQNPSVTVSAIAALGLNSIGESQEAKKLLQMINECQIIDGDDKGAFFAYQASDEYKRIHNWANYWGLYSNLIIEPQSVISPVVKDNIKYLISQQADSGGWSLTKQHPTKPFYTAHILLALMKAYKLSDEKDQQLIRSIGRGIGYLKRTHFAEGPFWAEDPSSDEIVSKHLISTLMSLFCCYEYQNEFGSSILSKIETINEVYFSYLKPELEKLLNENNNLSWPKIQENEAPTFHSWFSVASAVPILLELGISPWDSTIIKIMDWTKQHIMLEEKITGVAHITSPRRIVNWETGHTLIAIGEWEKKVLETPPPYDIVLQLILNNPLTDSTNVISLLKKLQKSEEQVKRWKAFVIVSIFISSGLGLLTLVKIISNNIFFVKQEIPGLLDLLEKVAKNDTVNFLMGFIGLIPLIVAVISWFFNKKKNESNEN